MSQLYPNKWTTSQGDILNSDGGYTENFLQWAKKTDQLVDSEWLTGFNALEAIIEKNGSMGKESWPPSYAEFIGICRPTISPDGVNGAGYIEFNDPKHPQYEEFMRSRAIESDDIKERLQAAYEKAKKEMMG